MKIRKIINRPCVSLKEAAQLLAVPHFMEVYWAAKRAGVRMWKPGGGRIYFRRRDLRRVALGLLDGTPRPYALT